MRKIVQEMQDNAIQTARIHPAVHLGNRDEVFIWQNFHLLTENYGTEPARLSHEHIENFIKLLEVWRDLGNRASPVNQAHMKRPLYCWRILVCVLDITMVTSSLSLSIVKVGGEIKKVALKALYNRPFQRRSTTYYENFWYGYCPDAHVRKRSLGGGGGLITMES